MAYSKITLYKTNRNKEKFVVVYYKHDALALRHRTSITVKEKDFDKKALRVKPSDVEYKTKNEIISNHAGNVEAIIESFIREHGIKPSSEYVKKQVASGLVLKQAKLEADLIDCYDDFLMHKRIQFNSPERSIRSLSDYRSTFNALKDYEAVVGSITPFDLINQLWLDKFNSFLACPRPKISGHKFLTTKQNDKTRSKRFGVLKNFGDWLVQNKYLKDIKVLLDYKVKVVEKDYYTLDLSEVKLVQEHSFKNTSHQKAIDMFIVACHTGIRFGDVSRVKKSRVKTKNGFPILILNNEKTDEKIEVPLTAKCISVLEKYDYKIGLMTDQSVNKYLHEALRTLDVFQEEYEYGTDGDTKPKSELITFHTGRRVFITNLVNNNVSLNAIMKMTGHKKISTLQKYINPDYELMMENVKVFNNL
jgi:integrase